MPIKVRVRYFQGNPFDVERIRAVFDREQDRMAALVIAYYDETTETFSGEHGSAKASAIETLSPTSRKLNIYVHGGYKQIYLALDYGGRRAFLMTKDFIPKTMPGLVGSGPGRGGVARSKSGAPRMLPKGETRQILPRNFTRMISELTERNLMITWQRNTKAEIDRIAARRTPWMVVR